MSIDTSRPSLAFAITGVDIPSWIKIVGVEAMVELLAHVTHEGGKSDAGCSRADLSGEIGLAEGGRLAVVGTVLWYVCDLAEVQEKVRYDNRG